MSERVTASDHSPCDWLRAAHVVQNAAVLSSAASGSIGDGRRQVRGPIRQDKRQHVTRGDLEFGRRSSGPCRGWRRRVQQHHVRARHCAQAPVGKARHPRDDAAVVEPQHELGPHAPPGRAHRARSDDVRVCVGALPSPTAGGMKSMTVTAPSSVSMLGLENEGVRRGSAASIRASGATASTSQRPCSGVPRSAAKQAAGIEAGPAEPVDGAVAGDERGGFAIADEGVVFERCAHALDSRLTRTAGGGETARRLGVSRPGRTSPPC